MPLVKPDPVNVKFVDAHPEDEEIDAVPEFGVPEQGGGQAVFVIKVVPDVAEPAVAVYTTVPLIDKLTPTSDGKLPPLV